MNPFLNEDINVFPAVRKTANKNEYPRQFTEENFTRTIASISYNQVLSYTPYSKHETGETLGEISFILDGYFFKVTLREYYKNLYCKISTITDDVNGFKELYGSSEDENKKIFYNGIIFSDVDDGSGWFTLIHDDTINAELILDSGDI